MRRSPQQTHTQRLPPALPKVALSRRHPKPPVEVGVVNHVSLVSPMLAWFLRRCSDWVERILSSRWEAWVLSYHSSAIVACRGFVNDDHCDPLESTNDPRTNAVWARQTTTRPLPKCSYRACSSANFPAVAPACWGPKTVG
jgi:hypothetical protein